MATATTTVTLTAIEAVDSVVKEVERTQHPPSEIINDSLLDSLEPTAFRYFARLGLVGKAADVMHHERESAARDELAGAKRTGFRGDGSNPRTRSVLASISMEDANGAIKPLEDFTIEDVEGLRITCEKQAIGWGKRSEWAARAGELLKRNKKAKRVVELPEKSVAELRQLAAEAWS